MLDAIIQAYMERDESPRDIVAAGFPEGEVRRVGESRVRHVDVRVIAATNRPLEDAIDAGHFRADLYYRLNVFPIRVPPLRDRPRDIPLLVAHFLQQFQRKLAKPLKGVTPDSMARLEGYPWPGNIRELRNAIERAALLSRGGLVLPENLPARVREAGAAPGACEGRGGRRAQVLLEAAHYSPLPRRIARAFARVTGSAGASPSPARGRDRFAPARASSTARAMAARSTASTHQPTDSSSPSSLLTMACPSRAAAPCGSRVT